ncbi:molybdate ABC transporter substrate-binding protein [Azospirillum brasilense]|uniref:Molybdate ABC transporter substrate-binding protein n=1 Tax=Azospirillum brasilense TaxID=192 RepID=A0A6L3B521_AZOBR|nr:molybdate ABC transporter substrate-binding protein [Azospirillum brasilense]KAA0687841.1 molybdate ABC transporter substrate-binding protein [Azospirillum brasilense]
MTFMDKSVARLDGAVHLFAAGSLKAALSELAQAFETRVGIRVATVFAPSGLLKARLLQSGESGLFASANMAHPRALADAGRATTVHPFARNQLCAIAQPEVEVSEDTLLDRLLDPGIRLGTSTPQADPAGDYVWDVFRKAEALRPGSFAALDAKALRLTGGPNSEKPPEGRNPYAWLMKRRKADLFLTYRTNARLAALENPALRIVALPAAMAVGADYGLAVLNGTDRARAEAFVQSILSPAGQAILQGYGFAGP